MGSIRTVRGDITPEQLGICHAHEHLLAAPPEPYAADDPDLVLDSIDAAQESLLALKAAGASALVEMTPIDYHRRAADLRLLSERTGMHIICITGFLKDKFCKPLVEPLTVDDIAARLRREIEHGIEDSPVCAGVIKASSSLNAITAAEEKVFLAAARAQQETGALISTHTEAGTMALEQIDLLTQQGVSPSRILIGHLDRKLDWDYHQRIADRGVYMGFDQIGKLKYAPDETRIEFIERLIAGGYRDQIMLSRDLARKSSFPAYGHSNAAGFPYLLNTFVPMLRAHGISGSDVDAILVQNPARALTR